jgi:peptidoglycan hydrolase-like protein with peptidoglycan-binding domain
MLPGRKGRPRNRAMARITISYRRDDSGVITGRIFDRLATHFGRDSIFRDIDSIPPGADFREHINHVLDESDILLAIVGPKWLGTRGGQTRLDDEADPVRVEIETGLRKKMPVIPVLVLRGAMPRASQLPDSVKDFAYRHAVQIDAGQDFDVHAARLIRAMDRILRQKSGNSPVRLRDETAEAMAIDAETSDVTLPLPGDIDELPMPAEIVRPIARPLPAPAHAAVTATPREPRRSGGLIVGLGTGIIVGAVVATIVTVLLRPAAPPDIAALATAKAAADAHALTLQAELAGTQKKLASVQDALDTAQKKLTDGDKHLAELQTRADEAAKDLAAQKDTAAKAQMQAAQLAAQVKSLGDQQARADQAEKDLAAQKDIAAEAQARADDLQGQLKTLGDQLAAATKARDDALAQIKSLQSQVAALPAQTPIAATAPAPDEPILTTDQKREVQRALRLLGHYQGEADGGFGPGTQAAIKQFQAFDGAPDTGTLTENERKTLIDMAQRLSLLLDQPPLSPQGVAAASIKGADVRYTRAYNFETGKGVKADPAEAAYWYALAAGDGEGKAFTNLGTLIARGFGTTKPNPAEAAVVWWAAATRGEAVAMYDLGVLNERGIGAAANLDLAKAWYQRAAALNDPDARAALKRLGA